MQGGLVDELLDIAVELSAFDQFEVEVGHILEDRVITGLAGDHGEERQLDAVDDGVAAHDGRVRAVEGPSQGG